jgi:FkbH-like protein
MPKPTHTCLLISDFTMEPMADFLRRGKSCLRIDPVVAPFNQVIQILVDSKAPCWETNPDFAVVWTQPGPIIPPFDRLRQFEQVPLNTILSSVDRFCELIMGVRKRLKAVFVPAWVLPSSERGWGMLDLKSEIGLGGTLMRMNLQLVERLRGISNIFIMDTYRWLAGARKQAFNATLWYGAKVAFSKEIFEQAAEDIYGAIAGIFGQSRKLIVLDLDDTLWGGIVGDIGWENIVLGGHDPVGEALVDFQKHLKRLIRRGVLLAIVSKNEEMIALDAIEKHPEMILSKDDFVSWRINWNDKAQNIADLVEELNLGLQSVVFIDDNPVERARVREALPEVFVPEWPKNKLLYTESLGKLTCFDIPNISEEDISRTKLYVAERGRSRLKIGVSSIDEWLKTLELQVTVEELNEFNLKRTTQLLNKTNQMNLNTRRFTETELTEWASRKNHIIHTFRVSDRFGDSGLTGIASVSIDGQTARIVDFILSCRVMGRKIEETMLHTLSSLIRSRGIDKLTAHYHPTAKNMPCLKFFENSGFQNHKGGVFTWDMACEYPKPSHVHLEIIPHRFTT